MKPYYDNNGITIYCADMRDVELPQADLVLTDPPYAEETHAGARTHPPHFNDPDGDHDPPKLVEFDSFTIEELRDCFNRIGGAAQSWVVSFMDWRHIYHFEQEPPRGLRFVRFGVWVKPNSAPQFTGDRPATGWEGMCIMHRLGGRMHWNGGGHHAVYTHNMTHHEHRISDNPTTKPMPLVAELIKLYSNPGALVLDPFMGSGTTIAAAKLLGRRAIGIDTNEHYCADLVRWLERPVTKRARKAMTGEALTLFDLA